MERTLTAVLEAHFAANRQMAFVSGPRQAGKSTLASFLVSSEHYLNWDRAADRRRFLAGADEIAQQCGLDNLQETPPVLAFDELHKYGQWKNFLKGFFDTWASDCRVLVTGSARLDVYKRGGDSLMGRYFPFRLHPLSLREILDPVPPSDALIRPPIRGSQEQWSSLWNWGGFPEPFLKNSESFHRRWRSTRTEQLIREDLRDGTRIQETEQLLVFAELLADRVGAQLNYSSLAVATQISQDTARRWLSVLGAFYYSFTIRPWFRNVTKAIRKQPKVFLWDWSALRDPGARAENFVACHLLKAVQLWTDLGRGDFDLFYLRDTAKREVDFLVSRDGEPWFLVDVKQSASSLSPSLKYFQDAVGAEHAFQVELDSPYVDRDCFEYRTPVRVPAQTFLSQLV